MGNVTLGDNVGYMDDKSGNDNPAKQATEASKPTYNTDGTVHWLEFDGVDDYLESESSVDLNAAEFWLFSLGAATSGTTMFGLADTGTEKQYLRVDTNQLFVRSEPSQINQITQAITGTDTSSVYSIRARQSDRTVTMFRDGVEIAQVTAPGTDWFSSPSVLVIGAGKGGENPSNYKDYGTLLVIDALSGAEHIAIVDYLAENAIWTPINLFQAGGQGVWYDPSDLTTLFQDESGLTPVAADGDPVGLMLDKSQNLALGSELVTNGTFDTDVTSWTPADVTLTRDTSIFPDGGMKVEATGTITRCEQNLGANFVVGRKYIATCKMYTPSTNSGTIVATLGFKVGSFTDADTVGQVSLDTVEEVSIRFTATSTTHSIYAAMATQGTYSQFGQVGDIAYFDNITVRELKGNHATQSVSASRPIYRTDGTLHWLEFDAVDDWLDLPAISGSNDNILLALAATIDDAIDDNPRYFSMVDGTLNYQAGYVEAEQKPFVRLEGATKKATQTAAIGTTNVIQHITLATAEETYLNGVRAATSDGGAPSADTNQLSGTGFLGAGYESAQDGTTPTTFKFAGDIFGCVFIYKSVSDADVTSLGQYLADQSGVTL